MAVKNKSDRKKLISTQVVETVLVFHRTDTGAEIARIDVRGLPTAIIAPTLVYGIKQIASDVVAGVEDVEKKIAGIAAAVSAIGAGQWPRRAAAPATMEPAIAAIMATQKCSRTQARAMLGLGADDGVTAPD